MLRFATQNLKTKMFVLTTEVDFTTAYLNGIGFPSPSVRARAKGEA
jgi:hypothetical protein